MLPVSNEAVAPWRSRWLRNLERSCHSDSTMFKTQRLYSSLLLSHAVVLQGENWINEFLSNAKYMHVKLYFGLCGCTPTLND